MFSEYPFLQPWLTALLLPPALPLLLLFLGYRMSVSSQRLAWAALGKVLFFSTFVALILLSMQGTAMVLERWVMRAPAPLALNDALASFKLNQVQAVVVLGDGLPSERRELSGAGVSQRVAQRLHYAAFLAKQSNLPVAFISLPEAGALNGSAETAAAQRWFALLDQPLPRWTLPPSADAARTLASQLKKEGINSIAVVTSAHHMPSALKAFANTNLTTLPAATQMQEPLQSMGLDWFPSAHGLMHSRQVLAQLLASFFKNRFQ